MVLYILLFGLLITNLLFKRNKVSFLFTILFMWIIMTFIHSNADEGTYISRYMSPEYWTSNTELLFNFLIMICRKMELSFVEFKGIISFIELFLISTTIWKLSKYPNVVLMLYFFCPFPLNVSQIRFALASSIFVYSCKYLIIDSGKMNKILNLKKLFTINDIKFIFIIIIASLIHSASILWLLLLIPKKVNIRTSACFSIVFAIFILLIFNPHSINWLLNKLGAAGRMNAYFSVAYQQSEFRHFGTALIVVTLIGFLTIFTCELLRKAKDVEDNRPIIEIEKYNIIFLSMLAFIIRYTSEMYRPQEAIMILNYIVISNAIPKQYFLKFKTKRRIFFVQTLLFGTVVICMFFKILLYNYQTVGHQCL